MPFAEKPDCPQCEQPDAVDEGEKICFGCQHDNDSEDFDACERRYGW